MAVAEALKNAMLDEAASLITHIGLGDDGAEIGGGDYARQAVSWGSASGGVLAMSGTETFDVPGSTTVNEVQLWSADEDGTKYGEADVTEEVFGGDGTYTVNTLTITLSDPA